ncbi:hypothetical protein [Croceimicrobium hydrocarbonivorans]|uniref:Uncharacterized protein n=1 Tax=Croceimicrobium hydrocarbonivorans TaxID=2761580 RepID=A0A7H0VHJ7_9FLAO|nr:hypothetical protein [Croceimicrobium hydrocarbonivorans]QNR25195.1 hypothetical protein H4K34_04970 [Croceimicrobium hydrocarbonivorans]
MILNKNLSNKLLPHSDLQLKSPLSESEVCQYLEENLEAKKALRFNSKGTYRRAFEGELKGKNFEIRRTINYQNSFLPKIIGTIRSSGPNTEIHLKMRLPKGRLLFLGVWFAMILFFLIPNLVSPPETEQLIILQLGPIAMLIFAYLLSTIAFQYEVSKAKRILEEIWHIETRN